MLTERQLLLCACASLEAQGDMERLDPAIRRALDGGVTINELKEAFSQLYAYTGFPRSLNALGTLQKVLAERKAQGILDDEVKHWHGARKDSWFQHLTTHVAARGEQSNEWLEPVTDEQYSRAGEVNHQPLPLPRHDY